MQRNVFVTNAPTMSCCGRPRGRCGCGACNDLLIPPTVWNYERPVDADDVLAEWVDGNAYIGLSTNTLFDGDCLPELTLNFGTLDTGHSFDSAVGQQVLGGRPSVDDRHGEQPRRVKPQRYQGKAPNAAKRGAARLDAGPDDDDDEELTGESADDGRNMDKLVRFRDAENRRRMQLNHDADLLIPPTLNELYAEERWDRAVNAAGRSQHDDDLLLIPPMY